MRYEKDDMWVELSLGIIDEKEDDHWDVGTNKPEKLPDRLHKQIHKNDKEGYEKLENELREWAEEEGFELVKDNL